MNRLHLYLTEELNRKIAIKAEVTGKSKAEVAREALEEGLKKKPIDKSESVRALLRLSKLADKLPSNPSDPRDLSINHDYYAWGGQKRTRE